MKKLLESLAVCVMMLTGVVSQVSSAAELTTLSEVAGKPVEVQVTVGAAWFHQFRVMLVKKITTTPQIAIWVEDEAGKYLDTLYVTEKFATQSWSGRREADTTYRAESLPYWMHQRAAAGLPSPTKNAPLPDAVTAASPDQNFTLQSKIGAALPEVFVLLELNHSFDHNDAYPEKTKPEAANYNGVSGQPSVVYRAKVNLNAPGRYAMTVFGHGSPAGADGQLMADVTTLTTALQIIQEAVVSVK